MNLVAKGVPVRDESERRALLLGSLAAGAATAAAEAERDRGREKLAGGRDRLRLHGRHARATIIEAIHSTASTPWRS